MKVCLVDINKAIYKYNVDKQSTMSKNNYNALKSLRQEPKEFY